jgi:hypothetical protein
MRVVFVVVAALLLGGCATLDAGSKARARLSSREMEDFRVCSQPLKTNQCGRNSRTVGDDAIGSFVAGPGMGEAVCLNGLMATYADASDKKRWLIRNGCPRDMVEE